MATLSTWIEVLIVIAWLGGLAAIKAYELNRHSKPVSEHPDQIAEKEKGGPGEKKATLLDEYNNFEFLQNLFSYWFSGGFVVMLLWATVMIVAWHLDK